MYYVLLYMKKVNYGLGKSCMLYRINVWICVRFFWFVCKMLLKINVV